MTYMIVVKDSCNNIIILFYVGSWKNLQTKILCEQGVLAGVIEPCVSVHWRRGYPYKHKCCSGYVSVSNQLSEVYI